MVRNSIYAASCDPNYGQRIVDIYLNCNGNYAINARSIVGLCSRNENGRFCYEFLANSNRFISFNYTNSLQSNCPSLYSYSNYECTDLCRDALQNLKSNVGCCLNSFYNISAYDSTYQYTNAGLWSACSVIPPRVCQVSTLTLGSATTSRNCSSAEVHKQLHTQTTCNAQVFQPTLDIYKQCSRQVYEVFIRYCGLNANNQLCLVLLNNSYPQAVESQCQNYTQGCTRSCHTALDTLKTALGCCVNVFNATYTNYRNTTDPALWSACGIPTPGFCPSTLLSQSTGSPSDSTAVPSTTRALTVSSLPTSSSEPTSAHSLDFPNTLMFVLLVLLNMHTCI